MECSAWKENEHAQKEQKFQQDNVPIYAISLGFLRDLGVIKDFTF